MQHGAEPEVNRVADPGVAGDLHRNGALPGQGHHYPDEPRVAAVRSHLRANGSERCYESVGEPHHVPGIGREQIQIPGGPINQAVREHRAPASERSVSGFGQGQRDSGELLVQRVETHEEEVICSRGFQARRT